MILIPAGLRQVMQGADRLVEAATDTAREATLASQRAQTLMEETNGTVREARYTFRTLSSTIGAVQRTIPAMVNRFNDLCFAARSGLRRFVEETTQTH